MSVISNIPVVTEHSTAKSKTSNHGTFGLVLVNIYRASRTLKLFPMRWKWRRTRMYQIMTLVSTLLLISSFFTSCSSISALNSNSFGHKKQRLLHIWEGLTLHESQQIFGILHNHKQELVPSLEIIRPEVFHRKRRRKRSSLSHEKEDEEKVIDFSGLGRLFQLTLRPNSHLLSLHDFVHLFRHENHSEILSDDIVKSQLRCFYHGSATHHLHNNQNLPHFTESYSNEINDAHHPNEIKKGRVALNICNGLTGFIMPVDNDPNDHYVIHPIPKRLQNSTTGLDHPITEKTTLPEHFIWRKQKTFLHNEDVTYPIPSNQNPQTSGLSFCGHDAHEPKRIKNPHSLRRKRSHTNLDDEDTVDQFSYRPKNVALDSYWLRFRSTLPPPYDDFGSAKGSVNRYSSSNYDLYRQESSTDSDSYRRQYMSDSYKQTQTPTQQSHISDYWTPTNGVIGHQTQSQSVTSAQIDDSIFGRSGNAYRTPLFPFYTSRSNNVALKDTSIRRGGVDEKYNHFNTTVPPIAVVPSSGAHFYRQSTQWTPTERKGRGDDTVFGENWHSSLDSDLMNAAHSTLAKTTVHKDREPAHLTIETAVFVDKDLYQHMQSNFPEDTQAEVSRIVLAMVNAVQLLYEDPSLGHRVEFVLKRLEVLETDPIGLVRPYDIDRFLTNFCKWQKTENPVSDTDPLHWDHALILTGLDLYVVHQSGKISNQVVGLAPVAGMCTRSSSCTVNEGRHFESVYVMAHEIGHNLGMRHDGPQADNECDPTSHIMSPTLGSGKITWSPCSKRYLDMFLETSQSKCLLDKAKSETRLDHDADKRLPGERFNADQQCVLKYGRGSFHATQQPIEDVCRDLHCRKQYYTWTSHPALEGTECGHDMSCRAGKCISKSQLTEIANAFGLGKVPYDQSIHLNNHLGMDGSETAAYSTLIALDGVWGKWSPFTDCSSACLYSGEGGVSESSTGIRLAARRCDSPRPENGGRQCSGQDRRYKTCNTEKICLHTSPRTSVSQYANEVCTRAATVDTELTGRGYMTTTNDRERACSVWCETGQGMGSRSRGWSFPDGTECQLSSKQRSTFCVAGKCQEFTCDPNSYFALSDELCNEISSNNDHDNSWLDNRRIAQTTTSGTYRHEKSYWTNWEPQSSCKLTCLAPSKGLELVQRKCNAAHGETDTSLACTGLALSVRLCKPDKSTVLANGCTRLHTAFEHATKLCKKYSEKVSGLSGIGMQLSPTKDDGNRPCRIGCQDAALLYRFYLVNGDEGWFPAGTDCSRGDPNKKAYCLGGKCMDFGSDDTPSYRINLKVLGRLESILRTKRESQRQFQPMDEQSLKELVDNFASLRSKSLDAAADTGRNWSEIDFSKPVVVRDYQHQVLHSIYHPDSDSDQNMTPSSKTTFQSIMEVEGSFYEWRKLITDCSVSCGKGMQEVMVQCISGETVVMDSLCEGREKPGESGYSKCKNPPCVEIDTNSEQHNSFLWNWIKSLLSSRSA